MSTPLTRRERRLYRVILWSTASVWYGCLLAFFVLPGWADHATLFEACLLGANTMVMAGFGWALRTDLRIIRGVPWLLKGPTDLEDR